MSMFLCRGIYHLYSSKLKSEGVCGLGGGETNCLNRGAYVIMKASISLGVTILTTL